MRGKIKQLAKNLKGVFIGIIIGGLIFGSIGVYASTYFASGDVTYDNTVSGLESTNVQGAIDELYNTCFPSFIIGSKPVTIVTSGDGLYADSYEDGKYTYKGVNPNNYVTFNNETAGWRIISINSDGTIKIKRDDIIGIIEWDSSGKYGNNNWNRPATLNTYLNGDYYNSLTSTAQGQIVESTYYAGAVTYDNDDMQVQINDEKGTTSNVKVALPTLSEYIRATSNTSCKTLSIFENNYICKASDWMYISNTSHSWTLSPRSESGTNNEVFYIYSHTSNDFSGTTHANTSYNHGVHPVVTLSSEVKITGGDGSQSNPYTIE